MLKQVGLASFFEFISHFLNVEQLLVDDTMKFLEVTDNFS
jgi:hypothetical protein